MRRVAKVFGIVLATAVLFVQPMRALADFGPYTTQMNEYLEIQMGQRDHTHVGGIVRPRAGRWGMYTRKGDPETGGDDNQPITIPTDDGGPGWIFGYSVVRVDGGSTYFGDQDAGGWGMVPFRSDPGLGNYDERGRNGFYIYAEYRVTASNIVAKFKMSIVRDQARFMVTLLNADAAPHSVGLMHCAMPDMVMIPFIPGRGFVPYANVMAGTDITGYLEIYDDRSSPVFGYRNTLRLEDCTVPDRVGLGSIAGTLWGYTPVPDRDTVDSWAVWWDPVSLNPGESRTTITYFGMAAASSSWTSSAGTTGSTVQEDPFCLAVQGPKALPINYDPAQPPEYMLQSNPFQIKAYVYNLDRVTPLTGVNVHLYLPEGLELTEGTSVQPMNVIPPETESAVVTWTVKANGKAAGELKYVVDVAGAPGLQKTVTRSIMVPATSAAKFRSGWQMVSVPFKFSDPRIEQSLNFAPDTYSAFQWDPQVRDYRPTALVEPGKAFWLNSTVERSTAKVASDARPFSGTEPKGIVLYTGWNQFGNPFLYSIPWGRVQVWYSAQVGPLSVEEAAARNIIRRTIYWFDPAKGEYDYSSEPTTWLAPWQGYWIKAMQPCQLIIPNIEQVAGGISGQVTRKAGVSRAAPPASSGKSDNWRLRLVAKAGSAADSQGVIGLDSRAADGYDQADVERPPSHNGFVAISFTHNDWGINSGSYMTDIRRSSGGTLTWEFLAASDQQNTDVVLTWPTIKDVPKNYSLKLVDAEAAVTRYMRTTSSYRYNTGSGGPRRFKIVAEPGGADKRLVITGLSVNTSRAIGGATISYNLSADAMADVRIKSIAGRTVRMVAQGKGATRGISSLTWNYRDEGGTPVPAGSYLIEVVAATPEGEVARAVRPFLVAR